jgi:hypothetical protein
MALIDTGTAIGSVSRLLKNVLTNALTSASPSPSISISRPEPGTSGVVPQGARLNLFLYEVQLDASLRNVSLTPGRQTPLWLVLRRVRSKRRQRHGWRARYPRPGDAGAAGDERERRAGATQRQQTADR